MPKILFPGADAGVRQRLRTEDMFLEINEFDWGATPLGPLADWPESLKSAVRMMLGTHVPMVLLVGPEGVLVYNSGYVTIAGDRHPGILGMRAVDAWPEIADFNRDVLNRVLAGDHLSFKDVELPLFRNGGLAPAWLDIEYSPLRDGNGTPIAAFAVLTETTQRILAERAVRRTEQRIAMALKASGMVGTWDWDVASNRLIADERFAEMFSIAPAEAAMGLPIERFLDAVLEEDRPMLSAEIGKSVGDGAELWCEFRLRGRDGAVKWVLASGHPHADEHGGPHFPGVLVDISEQKEQAEALAASEARFRTLADTMPQIVWSTRTDGRIDYVNARWSEFTGLPDVERDVATWSGIFHEDDRVAVLEAWREAYSTGEPFDIECRIRNAEGAYRWVLARALPVRDPAGRIQRWIGTCTDIHATRELAAEREVVAQELSHRIKNIFSVLVGIVALSARNNPEVKPFADQLRSRMIALGRAHDFVRPHSHASTPQLASPPSFSALMMELTAPYRDETGDRIAFSGDDVPIDDGAATPLALLIHELSTNAAKYGALAHAGGQISVTGRLGSDNFEAIWRETGVPRCAVGKHGAGFGSRLIGLSVEGQLRGKLERVWHDDGLEVRVSVPIAALRRSARLRT